MRIFKLIFIALLLMTLPSLAQIKIKPAFHVVPLGVWGGIDESNLSAYMVAPSGTDTYACLDAGTLHAGIEKAITNKVFNVPAEQVLKQYIKGYFISHSHLDHLAGLIINSPDDTVKNIYGLQPCLDVLKSNYFTWKSWANFANEGEAPMLNKYHYRALTPGQATLIENTGMFVQAFPLSHSNLQSTAFLLKSGESYLLYLGDTGADEIEKSTNLQQLWKTIAPLIKAKKLKGIMIEVSFPDEQPDKTLFGHLTPQWLMKEMTVLGGLTGAAALKNLNVVVTHLKPPADHIKTIKLQLKAENKLGLNLIYPIQGKALDL